MTRSEFEEKSYEVPLSIQLFSSSALFSPGQVFEHLLGFDVSGMVTDPKIWKLLGYSRVPKSVRLATFNMKIGPAAKAGLPNFPINLLIQAKRPTRMIRVPPGLPGKLVSPHYRIEFELQQHRTLARLQRILENRAVVSYASPVFIDWKSLHHSIQTGQLVQMSTFPCIKRVAKHGEWRYDRPGSVGCGHSTPEFIDEPDLFQQIQQAKDRLMTKASELVRPEPILDLATETYDRLGRLTRELFLDGSLPFSREGLRSLRQTVGPAATTFFGLQVTFARLGLIWAIV